MHARIDELLSLRDGEPLPASTREHVKGCFTCTVALQQLACRAQNLRELPQFDSPALDLAAIRDRALQHRPEIPAGNRWRSLAAAVVFSALVCFVLFERGRDPEPSLVRTSRPDQAPAASAHSVQSKVEQRPVAQLVAESRELEELLQKLPPPPEVRRVSFAATVDRIEQRVQWIDVQLSSEPDAADTQPRVDELANRLWRERVDLMDSLVKVRYAQSLPVSY